MLVTLSFPPRPALEFVEDADLWELMHGLPALAERLLQKRCKLVRSAEGDHVYRRKLPGGILLQDLVMYQRQVFEDRYRSGTPGHGKATWFFVTAGSGAVVRSEF